MYTAYYLYIDPFPVYVDILISYLQVGNLDTPCISVEIPSGDDQFVCDCR